MGSTSYTRILKPGYANNLSKITWLGSQVQRVLSGIVSSQSDSEEFVNEVQIQMQPRPDGALAVIGWIGRDPVEGMPDEQFDEEIELIPELPDPNTYSPPAPSNPTISPFQR